MTKDSLYELHAPEPQAEADWTPLTDAVFKWNGRTFVSGDPESDRLRVKYYVRESDHHLFAKVWFGPNTMGPPGHAHGGSMAAVLDEAMGFAGWVAGHGVLAAKIAIEFKSMLPIGTDATAEAWVENIDGRKVTMKATLRDPETGKIFAQGDGLFIKLADQHVDIFKNARDETHEHPEKEAWG